MTTLLDIDLETGDLTEFNETSTDGGDLSASATAKLHGNYGLLAVIDDATELYAWAAATKAAAGFRTRFYFDPNSITMANNDLFAIFMVRSHGGDWGPILRVFLGYTTAGGHYLLINAQGDGGTALYTSSNISDAVHYIEIKALCATNSTSANGAYEWFIDGTSISSASSVDNYNRIYDQNWGVYMEHVSETAVGTSGSIFFDDLIFTDTPNTAIGAVAGGSALPIFMNQYRQRKK